MVSQTIWLKYCPVVWLGKLAGAIAFEPVLGLIGYKLSMYVVAAFQILGVVRE